MSGLVVLNVSFVAHDPKLSSQRTLAALVSTQQVRPRPSALSRPVAGDAMASAIHPAMRGSHSAISGNTMTRMSAMN